MLFTETPKLRALERLMTTVPNFEPRASGFVIVHCFEPPPEVCPRGRLAYCGERTSCKVLRCPFLAKLIISGKARRADVLRETMSRIRSAAFIRRLNSLLRESEDDPMKFRNENHRLAFGAAISKLDRKNNALMSAVYLLTADRALWNQTGKCVFKSGIAFESFKGSSCTPNGYTLFCCAKDLYSGTKHLTIADLADTELVPPGILELVCSAMAIRRFGLGAIGYKKG